MKNDITLATLQFLDVRLRHWCKLHGSIIVLSTIEINRIWIFLGPPPKE